MHGSSIPWRRWRSALFSEGRRGQSRAVEGQSAGVAAEGQRKTTGGAVSTLWRTGANWRRRWLERDKRLAVVAWVFLEGRAGTLQADGIDCWNRGSLEANGVWCCHASLTHYELANACCSGLPGHLRPGPKAGWAKRLLAVWDASEQHSLLRRYAGVGLGPMAPFAAMQASVVAMGILLGATGAGTGVPEDATPGPWMRSGQWVVGVKANSSSSSGRGSDQYGESGPGWRTHIIRAGPQSARRGPSAISGDIDGLGGGSGVKFQQLIERRRHDRRGHRRWRRRQLLPGVPRETLPSAL